MGVTPEGRGGVSGKTQLGGWVVLPAQPFMLARHPKCELSEPVEPFQAPGRDCATGLRDTNAVAVGSLAPTAPSYQKIRRAAQMKESASHGFLGPGMTPTQRMLSIWKRRSGGRL
jgi:hypothetical protein